MIDGPLFLVGTGRCGSTIVYSCLAMHRSFGWINSWMTVMPGWRFLAAGNWLWQLPRVDSLWDVRFLPKPVEPNQFLGRLDPGYFSEGVTPDRERHARQTLVPAIERMLAWQRRRRFLGKLVGRPVKIDLLHQLYPDARFVHVTRGLRPSAASLLQVEFYQEGWLERWPWGEIPRALPEFYEGEGRPPELAAALALELNVREVERQLQALPPTHWIAVGYADFVADPVAGMEQIGRLAGFDVPKPLQERVRRRAVYGGADEKWRKYFSPVQQRRLDAFEQLAAKSPPAGR